RCHSKRTFSFSKQTRRSDESSTVFVRCAMCHHTYRM
ncbi:MAG: transcription factor S, partial [Chitinophagia bacterium]|nr:transcription factor S [Chitinophagia bacterium]